MVLSFSETVNGTHANADQIALQSQAISGAVNYTKKNYTVLGGATLEQAGCPPVLKLELAQSDANAIKNVASLAAASSSTYLSLGSSTVAGADGNSIVAISSGAAGPVSSYTADSTSPTLLTFTINMNTNNMMMNFDEPVDVGAFNANSTTIQGPQSEATGSSVSLTGGSAVVSSDGLQVML